jgi:biopolymer transport protein ExbB
MKKVSFIFALGLSFISPFLLAQSINSVRNEAKTDLQEAIKELAEWRNSIEEEKIPMARRVAALEAKARKLRSQLEHYLRLRDNREASLLQLEKEVTESENELDFSLNLLRDYITSWHQTTPPAEETLWSPKLSAILLSLQQSVSRMDSLDSAFRGMSLSIESIQKTAGGISFSSNAIVPPEGSREAGNFWSIGPIIFFAGNEGSSGFLEHGHSNKQSHSQGLSSSSVLKLKPARIRSVSPENSVLITNAFSPESSDLETITLPLDPTLGKASVMEEGELNPLEELQKGGIWIYPILFFAVLSLIIAMVKAIQIIQVQMPKSAASLDKEFKGPFELLRKTAKGYQGKNPEILEEILYEAIIDVQVKLEKALPLIAVTAATAPLLGLLGTVTGMIDVFRQITNFANPENSELARGISEALVTTKFGLVTAIPALIVHALLTRRLQGIISKMEGFSGRLVRLTQEEKSNNLKDSSNESDS